MVYILQRNLPDGSKKGDKFSLDGNFYVNAKEFPKCNKGPYVSWIWLRNQVEWNKELFQPENNKDVAGV